MTERVLNLVTYIQWEKPQVIEYDKIFNGLKALFEILSIYSYIINMYITILVKQVYWYISQVSGERLQDHWSSGLFELMLNVQVNSYGHVVTLPPFDGSFFQT